VTHHVVRLVGGPMDGWIVSPDAPALDPEWPAPEPWKGCYVGIEPDEDGTPRAGWAVVEITGVDVTLGTATVTVTIQDGTDSPTTETSEHDFAAKVRDEVERLGRTRKPL